MIMIWAITLVFSATILAAMVANYAHFVSLKNRIPLAAKQKALESKVQDLSASYADITSSLSTAKDELNTLNTQLLRAAADRDSAVKLKDEAYLWLKENEVKVNKIPEWVSLIDTFENKADKVQRDIEALKNDQIQVDQLLRAKQREFRSLEQEIIQLNNEKEIVSSDVTRFRDAREEHRQKATGHALKVDALQEKLAELTSLKSSARHELDELKSETKSLDNHKSNLRADIVELHSKIKELEREKDVTEGSVHTFKDMLNNLSTRVDTFQKAISPPSVEERLQDFKRPVLALPGTVKGPYEVDGRSGERVALDQLELVLQQKGLIFDQRTIYSFHTSLKVSESSPLVVLAGISGTGKSLLPRMYAEVMGIHFLNVAVQPRWDSPQDLFGFYNYMEHRYKATDLARALRQLDGFNYPAENEQQAAIKDGLLLVLLDEMNLARVEYYFSDLLSKLEIRSRSDEHVKHKRDAASLDVELGSIEQADENIIRPLYIGFNVLFVGTMNEDETTQSLSDKVLDRSNLLRFGRPDLSTRITTSEDTFIQEGYLRYKAWESWQESTLTNDEENSLLLIIEALNDALDLIGRPFGMRVKNAIMDYVANYPNWVGHRVKIAVADQLVQRILPKLRGLSEDTDDGATEALNRIEEIIHDLEDDALKSAFESSRTSSVFHFKGVIRS